MQPRSLALRTDLCFDRFRGEVIDRDGYLCVRTPENPHFWYGNSLIFPAPPEPGDHAHWMALFEEEIRTATIRARGAARVLTIDKKNFLGGVHEDPSLALRIVQTMSHRIRDLTDRLAHYEEPV